MSHCFLPESVDVKCSLENQSDVKLNQVQNNSLHFFGTKILCLPPIFPAELTYLNGNDHF